MYQSSRNIATLKANDTLFGRRVQAKISLFSNHKTIQQQ